MRPPPAANCLRDREELVVVGKGAGHRCAVDTGVAERARRGEAVGAGLHRLAGQRAHLGDVGRGGLLVLGAALPHHIAAQRSVWQLHRDVDGPLAPVEHVEELRKRLPAPLHAFVQRGARDVLHSLHQLDEPALSARPHRREADTAVAGHHGGHAVRRRRLEHVVPGGLPVVVRVRIDKTGRDDATRRVDGRLRRLEIQRRRDLDDAAVTDRDVAAVRRAAGPVDDLAAVDHQVMHPHPPDRDDPTTTRPTARGRATPLRVADARRGSYKNARCSA